tara:strand:- start:5968 stop:6873 length:906 start_codon:yes stop_codon:yes gene_type:complete
MPLWKPSLLDNLQFWVRGDSLSNMTNGGDVTFWEDESGNGFHVDGAPSKFPDVVHNAQNDLPAVEFDRGNATECMSTTATTVTDFREENFHMCVVFKTASTGDMSASAGNRQETVYAGNIDNSAFEVRIPKHASTRNVRFFGNSENTDNEEIANNLVLHAVDRSGLGSTDASIFLNGKEEQTFEESFDYIDAHTLMIGAVGTAASPSNGLNGQICEIIFYADSLTDDERVLLEGYLANKWDSATLLEKGGGSSHTYKTKKPIDGLTLSGEDLSNTTMDRSLIGDMATDLNLVDSEHGGLFM